MRRTARGYAWLACKMLIGACLGALWPVLDFAFPGQYPSPWRLMAPAPSPMVIVVWAVIGAMFPLAWDLGRGRK